MTDIILMHLLVFCSVVGILQLAEEFIEVYFNPNKETNEKP